MKILICDGLGSQGLKKLQETAALQVESLAEPLSGDAFIDKARAFDFLVVRSATKLKGPVLEKLPNLKGILRAGVGLDNVDVEKAAELGILVWNAPTGNFQSTAELALAQIFALARSLVPATLAASKGQWLKNELSKSGRQLCDSTLGIYGLGNIGSRLGKMAQAIGMKVVVCDPVYKGTEFERLDFDNFLSRVDFISIHAPLLPDTKGVFNAAAFSKMKKGSFIVNCARGGIINESALLEALESGHLGGAGLDVFEVEPFNLEDEKLKKLISHPKVVVTPHVGASTAEAQKAVGLETAEKIIALEAALSKKGVPPKPIREVAKSRFGF